MGCFSSKMGKEEKNEAKVQKRSRESGGAPRGAPVFDSSYRETPGEPAAIPSARPSLMLPYVLLREGGDRCCGSDNAEGNGVRILLPLSLQHSRERERDREVCILG
ncbi:hypothetical protein R1flu_006870 [Riccia fluitans]|uniref:Uncharacterized protein n=1 Tax=Riccia fluitans TaxID=41844 RepID=A0ABD1YXU4_9MARC